MWRVASKCELRLPLLQGAAGAEGADQRGQVPRDRYIFVYFGQRGCENQRCVYRVSIGKGNFSSNPVQFARGLAGLEYSGDVHNLASIAIVGIYNTQNV